MAIENVGQKLAINGFFLQELRYSQEVFRPANSQRDCCDMLRPQNTRFHGPLCLADWDLYLSGASDRLSIKVTGHRQKLNRPALNDDPLLLVFDIPFLPEVRKYRSKHDETRFFPTRVLGKRYENVQVLRYGGLNVIISCEGTADCVSTDDAFSLHPIQDSKRLLHPHSRAPKLLISVFRDIFCLWGERLRTARTMVSSASLAQ